MGKSADIRQQQKKVTSGEICVRHVARTVAEDRSKSRGNFPRQGSPGPHHSKKTFEKQEAASP